MQSKSDREKVEPYLIALRLAFRESGLECSLPGFELSIFAALVYRESHFGWAPGYTPKGDPRGTGDGGHGRGLCQIDDRTWSDWIKHNDWGDPLTNMRKACSILRDTRGYLKTLVSMPGVDKPTFLRSVLAAYNCGPSGARKGLIHDGDPDKWTAGGDYSKWIIAKAGDLVIQMPELLTC